VKPEFIGRSVADLRKIDTCSVANAIENHEVRLRNEGFIQPGIRCQFPAMAPMVGYAVPVKIRCSTPSPEGHPYKDRTDWWNYILKIPAPRVVVIQDVDTTPGLGAFIGEMHATILKTLGCVGAITNGTVRDLPAVAEMGFQLFASGTSVSHAYVHVVEIGREVTIGGLKIQPGELLHGDQHGVVSVPPELAAKIPETVAGNRERERKLMALCQGQDLELQTLRDAVRGINLRDGHTQ
jgi:4-hydroxy-4-methyl-2-oxoglutarate aldolase